MYNYLNDLKLIIDTSKVETSTSYSMNGAEFKDAIPIWLWGSDYQFSQRQRLDSLGNLSKE